jgi:hypothetical protein
MRLITIKKLVILLALAPFLLLSSCKKVNDIPPPQVTAAGIHTSGLDYYIKIAETLLSKQEPPQADWDSLFASPAYKIIIEKGITPEMLKADMRPAYTQETLTAEQQKRHVHHLRYKGNLAQLKSYSASVKDGSIRTALKQHLYPYLPARLQKDELIPPIVYTFYIGLDANGSPQAIFQDAYLSYLVDGYAKGILTAHEAFHSVITGAVNKRLKISRSNTQDPQTILFITLNGISQEGIADLIDKEVLFRTDSPVYDYLKGLTENEDQRARNYLQKLNEELALSNTQGTLHNPSEFNKAVSGDVGHVPGRFMGKVIKQAGLLEEIKPDVENPFNFIYTYNKAAAQFNGTYPILSAEAINFLKKAEPQIIEPLK